MYVFTRVRGFLNELFLHMPIYTHRHIYTCIHTTHTHAHTGETIRKPSNAAKQNCVKRKNKNIYILYINIYTHIRVYSVIKYRASVYVQSVS